jgi:tRNA threonylcarbamoyl adenosine modification protein YeaZ
MKILALEFSSPQRSVAAFESRADARPACGFACETGGGGVQALSLVEAALREARLEREQIECIAIGLGPGSYAGIRGAISLAQGWQLARDVKLLGASSVECLAAQAQAGGLSGRIHIVIDAQRNEFYLAGYEIKMGVMRMVEPLRLATLAEVEARAGAGDTLVGPEVTRWFPKGQIVFPDAATLARLAAERTDFVPGETLAPIYLRETSFVKAPPPRTIL